ncbi:sucrose-6-phosphate hydrolase SacC (GH32 family) [Kribbella rubisoli]|uniref:beta-fructofuranosidase n=1 Tax=Kribbella rubisoli TaxID=3075929 RepID=A0A4Q7WZ04_9ACTN|nr:glycoside hydrolase family 32 protein [Kribbella rubisoli]RZU15791.1 sucrose-6-phosphate hydrolase SacC (GH32 family) [Kribbella rubisoli]
MTQTRSAHRSTGTVAHLRPRYHVRPPSGYLNDPNGPIELGSDVHLYFQSRPTLDLQAPVEWGHATSPDYVRWTLHRPAMAPQPGGPDTDGCWSGNTVMDDGRIRAFYSGRVDSSPYQSVLTAVSDDGGASFGPAHQVVPDPAEAVMFRDPFVWKENGTWWMVVGAGYVDRGASLALYRSPDLSEWTAVDPLAELHRTRVGGEDTGSAWECPQVLTIDGRRIAVAASWSPEGGPGEVLSFDVDAPPAPQRVDHGTDFYAASAMRESRFGPLLFGWLPEGRDRPGWNDGWAGVISLPRRVWLGADSSLRSAPVPTMDTLRTDSPGSTAQLEIVVPDASGRVVVHFSDEEYLTFELDADTFAIDRSHASVAPYAHGGRMEVADAFDPASDRPAARIFLDGSVVEAFTSAGRVLSTRVYPTAPPPWRIEAPANTQCWGLAR